MNNPVGPRHDRLGDFVGAAEKTVIALAHRIPFPPDKGDKIRTFHTLSHLSENGWQVHLCALADHAPDLAHVAELKRRFTSVIVRGFSPSAKKWRSLRGPLSGRPLSVGYFYDARLQNDFDLLLARVRPNSVLCVCSPMAEYVFRNSTLRSRLRGNGSDSNGHEAAPRLVMDLIDADSEKWSQYSLRSSPPLSWAYRLESRLLARYETEVADKFDATILVSNAEADLLRARTKHGSKIQAVSNGVDLEFFHPNETGQHSPVERIVFCGAMDYFPNVDAVLWFAREVLPMVKERYERIEFLVVGANPTAEVRALSSAPGIIVTGSVPDIRPFVWGADVSVAPLRLARGIQNKVLEAMAMGKPVVASPQAFEGIQACRGRDLLVADPEPRRFADALLSVLGDENFARSLSEHARHAVSSEYSWESRLSPLDQILSGAGRSQSRKDSREP